MLSEFKTFIAKGNVIDLAVAVIIGGAFATITASLTQDIIMPLVGAIFGGVDFSTYFIVMGPVPAEYSGSMTNYAELKDAGGALLGYGQFVTVVLNFIILAFVIFLLVRQANRIIRKREKECPRHRGPPR